MIDKRKHPRSELSSPVAVFDMDYNPTGSIIDVAENGFKVLSNSEFETGSTISFSLGNSSSANILKARCIWSKRQTSLNAHLSGFEVANNEQSQTIIRSLIQSI